MKKILVPTDFSAGAANALCYAYSLADAIQSSIILLHVIEIKMEFLDLPIPSGATYQAQKEAATLAMEAQIEFAHQHYSEQKDTMVKIESVIKGGNPISVIKATAAEFKPHLIVMGARGKKKSELEKMLGTLSSAVAERAHEPVLIVPEGCTYSPVQELVYASDLLLADSYQLWSALKIIEPFSPVVRWVHVSKESSEEEISQTNKMRQYQEEQNPALQLVFYQLFGKDINKELAEFTKTFEPDLLVIFHQPKNIFVHFFTQSHTKELVSMVEVPLLILKKA